VRAAFAELGVPATASVEEVKRAYRRRVKDVHPDQGGDEDEFKRVREAYTLAKQHAD
jgi:curved DNA-binding protein CbpA